MSFSLFGPLDKNYCVIFYIFTVISFVLMFVGILGGLFVLMKKPKLDYSTVIKAVIIYFNLILTYFIYRLLHTMCIKSL
uniref:Uncharacterized protein n=1 Tax=viral metagenome TaxID=1070528 RepID=A0A6C0HSH1_9ZZZZ